MCSTCRKSNPGQMAIESIEFCPLDMLEDTLHTYAAFAQRKGLQLYGCIDAQLPDWCGRRPDAYPPDSQQPGGATRSPYWT